MRYDGQKVLIVGLGESGKAAVRFFAERGASVTVADSRAEGELGSTDEIEGCVDRWALGAHSDTVFVGQDLVVPSPGVPWNLPQLDAARKAGVRVAGELEIAAGELRGRTIGVTGSNGKTTTTALIGHILAQAGLPTVVAGNIGTPVLAIASASTDEQWNVLELSSFQLEAATSFRPEAALILNVTPDHLDRHGTFENYTAAKARILRAQEAGDAAILNADDPVSRSLESEARGRVRLFSRRRNLDSGAWVVGDSIVLEGRSVASTDLPIRGAHNLENALAAALAASEAGVSDQDISKGLQSFTAVEHRLEFVRSVAGVGYYNDSKATNVDATLKAIEAFDHGLWVVLGGRDKSSDYRPLRDILGKRAKQVLLIGEAAEKIREQLAGAVDLRDCFTLEQAVKTARSEASSGDTVLLSPACASFDQFGSYGERGRAFKHWVGGLD